MVDMKRSACKCPSIDSRPRVYAHSMATAFPGLTSVIIVITVINSRGYLSNPYVSQSTPSLSAFVDARNTNDRLALRNRRAFLVLLKGFASWSPQLAMSQSLSSIFDQLLIAAGEDEGLMREAFKEIRIATSPSDHDWWTISDDRKGIERKFEFKSFTICWVCWIQAVETWVNIGTLAL